MCPGQEQVEVYYVPWNTRARDRIAERTVRHLTVLSSAGFHRKRQKESVGIAGRRPSEYARAFSSGPCRLTEMAGEPVQFRAKQAMLAQSAKLV